MKTIVIAAQKGGAGKTTLARNLAVAASQDGRDVLCLDLDPQGSLRAWWEGRDADAPSMLDRDPAPDVLRATLNAAQAQFDLCIIDTPPAAPEWLAEALGAADLVLISVRPSPDDLRAVARRSHGLQLWSALPVEDEELEQVWAGKKTAKQALDSIVSRGNELLERFEKANKR